MTLHKLLAMVYAKLEVMNKNKADKRIRQAVALNSMAGEANERANAAFQCHKLRLTELADGAYYRAVKEAVADRDHARELEKQVTALHASATQKMESANVQYTARCRAIDNETLKGTA